jgi:hypothetical protein
MPAPLGRAIAVISDNQPGQAVGSGGSEARTRNTVVSGGTMASGEAGKPAPAILQKSRTGRLGWREVMDWEGVRNAVRQK